jgi:hypothetical protein
MCPTLILCWVEIYFTSNSGFTFYINLTLHRFYIWWPTYILHSATICLHYSATKWLHLIQLQNGLIIQLQKWLYLQNDSALFSYKMTLLYSATKWPCFIQLQNASALFSYKMALPYSNTKWLCLIQIQNDCSLFGSSWSTRKETWPLTSFFAECTCITTVCNILPVLLSV